MRYAVGTEHERDVWVDEATIDRSDYCDQEFVTIFEVHNPKLTKLAWLEDLVEMR